MITMGVDIGSASSKAIIMEDGAKVLAKKVVPLGTGTIGPSQVYQQTLELAGLTRAQIHCLVATGYGRLTFEHADTQVSEVSCHGKGVHFLKPSARTVIDIGGQDAKAISLDENGFLIDFVMNDKCAAGTGRFLDVMAHVLNVHTEDLGELSTHATQDLSISNVCTVFAESEVISHLSAGQPIADIVAGIHRSVAKRAASLAIRIGVRDDVVMSGGVALNGGVVSAMAVELKRSVFTMQDAQLAGAYGASIIAYEKVK